MTGVNNGISTKLREHPVLKHMLNIYRIVCHRLALPCADYSSQPTLKDLINFGKTALKMHDLNTLAKNKF